MKLEEAVEHLKNIAKEYKTYGDLDNPEFEDTEKIVQAIETVLQALESYKRRYELAMEQNVKDYKNSIPNKKIEDKIKELEENGYWEFLEERDLDETINILQELLEGN